MADEKVTDDPLDSGETPPDGEVRVYAGSVVIHGEDNRIVLTDRVKTGDYIVDTNPPPDEDDDDDDSGGGGA